MSYVAQIRDFMSGDFMSGDFLTWIHFYIKKLTGKQFKTHSQKKRERAHNALICDKIHKA